MRRPEPLPPNARTTYRGKTGSLVMIREEQAPKA